ncbi:exonuclease domain-containing protein [Nesterenkonia haasae]|uniref:exonuclease domain-containing protein n=1 Tax=Nesterenkonia haasae TaxID=2587813 RepID=UPI001391AEA7|nr:exonuclease domain-containing protein [Nesterenkonia haasae]NDK31393.1 3'-5' exonuclease [Nesterenkonia haasae]
MESEALFDLHPVSDSWHRQRRVGFDLETTSRFPAEARIVSAALVTFDPEDSASPRVREWLVDPGVEIPEETVAIHGISTEYAREHGQDAAEAVAELLAALTREFLSGSAVVVMNAPYDLAVLRAEAERYGLEFPIPRPIIDPLVIDKQVDKYRRGKRRLPDLCGVHNVELAEAHSAAPDALAAVQVADCQAEKYPELQMPADELHALQSGWKADQAEDFQAYLHRQGKIDAVIDGAWPL